MVPSISPHFLSLDLEVGKKDHRIRAFAAVRTDVDQPLVFRGGDLTAALAKLDDFADGADFLLGHNLIDFDLPHLKAAKPNLRMLKLPAVDTLWLNPLAFPRNPYHHLVKHYQDGQLKRGRLNDPELDARLALDVFNSQQIALRDAPLSLLAAWHWLTGTGPDSAGFDAVFAAIRYAPRPTEAAANAAIRERLAGIACQNRGQDILKNATQSGWPLAYALAWLSVSGGNSVMPPWVRHQFPEASKLVRQLRDMPCGESNCDWCGERHDPRKELKRWFGFDDFRPEPMDEDGRPMQQTIVEAAMAGEHVLGILPTGTGKSLCYQIPALSRYDKTGALTVVISPLVVLMADQVAGLEAHGIGSCVAINGLLSMPERADALDRVRLGDAGILIISPEQLRSTAVRRVLDQREIGAWVLDEAHCLSKWGQTSDPIIAM
jgi:ATP-dependent DNA helicase RecQ